MRGHTQSIFILAIAAAAGVGGYFAHSVTHGSAADSATTQPAEDAGAIPVATEPLRRGPLSDMGTAYGVVQNRPGDVTTMAVPFECIPKAVHVAPGEWVEAGAAIADIEPSPDAMLQLRQAEEAAKAAEKTADQLRRRRDEQLATNADVATAEQALELARTQLAAQQARGVGDARTLKAEHAGVVVTVAAQRGQVAAANAALVTIALADSLEAKLSVEPGEADTLAVGAAVMVKVPGSTNALACTVRQRSRVLNAQRLCDVFVTPNAVAAWPVGTFVEGEFSRQTVNGLIVPRAATQMEDEDWCVYTVADGKAVRHVVKLGATDGQDILITGSGLAENDDVVVERDGELQDGASVKVEPPEEDAK